VKRLRLTDRGRGVLATLATLGSYATAWTLGSAAPYLPGDLYLTCRVATYAWAIVASALMGCTLMMFIESNPTEEVKS